MADAWTRIGSNGKVVYDDPTVDFDDAFTAYDGGDGADWVPISKPTT